MAVEQIFSKLTGSHCAQLGKTGMGYRYRNLLDNDQIKPTHIAINPQGLVPAFEAAENYSQLENLARF